METSLSGVRRCAHTGLNPVACYVSFETRAFEIYAHIAGWSKDVIYQNDTGPIRKFDSHSREPAELENNNYRMIS